MDFAKSFNTHYSEHCGEYLIKIPEPWGEGIIQGIDFEGGLGLLHYACTFHEDLEIQFVVNKIHPLKYLFCLEGNLNHRFANETSGHVLEQFQNVIVASEQRNGHVLNFRKGELTDMFSVEIDRKRFKQKSLCDIQLSNPKIHSMFEDDIAKKQFYYKGWYSLVLAGLFQELKDFDHDALIRKIFLEGKAYQIVANQLLQLNDDQKDGTHQTLLRKSDVKSIKEAAEFINSHLDTLESVKSIAHRVGLNSNKIQEGFKVFYGLTVNAYIQKTRLEVAKNLLLTTDDPIQEIMQKVGWNSKSYFSKIFKDTYLKSPSEFRKHR